MYVSQISMQHTLGLYSEVCQLRLNKTRRKIVFNIAKKKESTFKIKWRSDKKEPHLTSSDHNPDQGGVICAGAFHRIVEPLSKEGRAVQGTLHWKWQRLQTWNHDLTKMSTHQLHLSLPAAFDHFLCNYHRNLKWLVECSPPWFFSAPIFLSSCIRQSTFNSTRFPLASTHFLSTDAVT